MPRQTNVEDEEQFLKELTKLGGSARNVVLREALDWGEPHYGHVRQRLIDEELVENRRGGPGGTVCLKDRESDKQKPPRKSTATDAESQKVEIGDYKKPNANESEDAGPLLREPSNTEALIIEVVLVQMRHKKTIIPSYQRDSDQWSPETKSLFIETVINNLPSPALFFETTFDAGGFPINEIVDGQQRLVTLCEFFDPSILQEIDKEEFGFQKKGVVPEFRLVDIDRASYISPNCERYAGRTYKELLPIYQDTFQSYRLPIILLGDLKDLRYEVFQKSTGVGSL